MANQFKTDNNKAKSLSDDNTMVDVTLTNHNKQSSYQQAVIHLETGTCVIDNKKKLTLKQFLKSEFEHPLITQAGIQPTKGVYHYEYDDMEGFLKAPAFVFATLLQANNPKNCQFKINPSNHYHAISFEKKIYFSIDKNKAAEEAISIQQLECIIKQLYEHPFHFSEDMVLHDEFNLSSLPEAVNGDDLYKVDKSLLKLLTKPIANHNYEIRYIHPTVGLGVFARKHIKENTPISSYVGIKTNKAKKLNYAFCPKEDCFNRHTDAREFGNICRFVNHSPDEISSEYAQAGIVEANVICHSNYLNGQQILVYKAKRDVREGEQLLVNYGNQFFTKNEPLYFNKKNLILDADLRYIDKRTPAKIYHFRVMANYGVKKAQIYLIKRTSCIFILMGSVLFCSIKALSFL